MLEKDGGVARCSGKFRDAERKSQTATSNLFSESHDATIRCTSGWVNLLTANGDA